MFFSQDWRERVKAENPDAGFGESTSFRPSLRFNVRIEILIYMCEMNLIGEVGKLLGAKWKEMDDKEKAVSCVQFGWSVEY